MLPTPLTPSALPCPFYICAQLSKGMGGGTGTGAAPVIAAAARSMGCVTVAVVTEPFEFEGRQRSRQAAAGLAELRTAADTVLVVANDKLLEIVPGRMTMSDAFLVADDVLRQGVSQKRRASAPSFFSRVVLFLPTE